MHGHEHGQDSPDIRTKALEALLVEKGLITSEAIDEVVQKYEEDIGPIKGAQVVARAWTDPDYKKRLLDDGRAAVAEFGYIDPHGAELVVVENTSTVHNMVVCTLCSCYPWAVLGLPPTWYKSYAYRSRAVREPRLVLREFGLDLPESVEVRVWDSNSDIRYMVLPQAPAGIESMEPEQLVELVNRDSMIGTGLVAEPGV
ncbi:MAG: nitrile hydratase subunit alpha [Candidatus Latescibacteria bacterium]|nr:nitrile hydratase subunit alpha [Candidatus Latescibacterota bacterium]